MYLLVMYSEEENKVRHIKNEDFQSLKDRADAFISQEDLPQYAVIINSERGAFLERTSDGWRRVYHHYRQEIGWTKPEWEEVVTSPDPPLLPKEPTGEIVERTPSKDFSTVMDRKPSESA